MFPDGWPGAGLLLLRAAGGAVLIIQGVACFGARREPGFLLLTVVSIMIVVGVLLLIGFVTRLAALAAAIAYVSSIFPGFSWSNAGPLVSPMTAGLSVVIGVAVICLGPGAFSLDSRLFGRREIIIPTSLSK